MIIAEPKTKRKSQQYDPSQYEPLGVQQTPGTVQLMSPQVQPQQPMPQVQQPIQQPVAQPQWNVTGQNGQPVAQPQTMTPGTWNVQGQPGQQIAQPAMNAPGGPPSDLAQVEARRQAKLLADRQARVDAALAEQRTTTGDIPASVIAPDTDAELAKEAKSDPVISGLEDKVAAIGRAAERRGGKVTPADMQRIAQYQKQAADRLKIVQGSVDAKRAEQAKKDKNTQDAIDMANASAQRSEQANKRAAASAGRAEASAARAESDRERNKEAARLSGKAQESLGTGDHDNAEKLAREGLRLFPDTTAQAEFNTVLQGVRTAKTTKAAAAMKPKVDAAKQVAKDAEDALDATHAAIEKLRIWKLEHPPSTNLADEKYDQKGMSDREAKLVAQEPKQRAERDRLRAEYDKISQQHGELLSGQLAPQPQGQRPTISTEQEYNALPVGATYRDAQGNVWRKK